MASQMGSCLGGSLGTFSGEPGEDFSSCPLSLGGRTNNSSLASSSARAEPHPTEMVGRRRTVQPSPSLFSLFPAEVSDHLHAAALSPHDSLFTLSKSFRSVLFLTTTGFQSHPLLRLDVLKCTECHRRFWWAQHPRHWSRGRCSGPREGASPNGGAVIPVGTPC